MERGTKAANFVKIAQGIAYARAGRLYSEILKKISKLFSFGVLWHYCCTAGVNFEEWTEARFHPIGATCRPCGAKNPKLDGCIVWNAHTTVFGSKRSAICALAIYFVHSTRPKIQCLLSRD